jgi:hypothetical protein
MVTLGDVTRDGVLAAIEEFDHLGREEFLRSTGFGRARRYFLDHRGQLYDSKAIVGYAHAHGVSPGTPLGPGGFSGSERKAARRLKTLDFTVRDLQAGRVKRLGNLLIVLSTLGVVVCGILAARRSPRPSPALAARHLSRPPWRPPASGSHRHRAS